MTDQITLNADQRERTGTNKAREIRNVDGMVPAIVYGDEKETLKICIHTKFLGNLVFIGIGFIRIFSDSLFKEISFSLNRD